MSDYNNAVAAMIRSVWSGVNRLSRPLSIMTNLF